MIFEKQQYQYDCVNNILKVLEGVDFKTGDFSVLTQNLASLAKKHNYDKLPINNDKRLDVLMETGTGKTFTYLKTIFELNKKFNQTKFIIVLPRTAIKLGTIQNIKLTDAYFFNEYGKHLNYINYPEDGLNSIQQNFINANDLSVVITTNAAFNSEKNRINTKFEGLYQSGSIWNGIASKNPVIIIDEPHLLKGTETKKGLNKLENSLFIRFGATYPNAKKDKEHQLSNVVYILDSISAFNQYLVKKIGVSTIFANSEQSSFNVSNIKSKYSFDVTYNINEQLHKVRVRKKEDLGAKTGLAQYQGVSVEKINANKIFLSNQTTLEPTKGTYQLSEQEIKQMLIRSIELHFEKEQRLFEQNIKTLALFFIPKIDDFRGDNPLVKNIFNAEYKRIRHKIYQETNNQDYKDYLDKDYQDGQLQVAEGYFSGDKGTVDKKISDGVDVILNNKEKLLSFDTPLRFIFSVWALQEGWDNPNIFTICKLSSTDKETSRRQQVGRGLRVALNQSGKRLTYQHLKENQSQFFDINMLDMVVSGQEQDFIYQIQNEIASSSFTIAGDIINLQQLQDRGLNAREIGHLIGILEDNDIVIYNEALEDYQIQSPILDFLNHHQAKFHKITNERFIDIKKIFTDNHTSNVENRNNFVEKVKIKKNHWKKFKKLWEAINKQSKIVYQNIDEDNLINAIARDFNKEEIHQETITITKEIYNTQQNKIEFISENKVAGEGYFNQQNFNQFVTKFSQDENLSLVFMSRLFNQLKLDKFYNNPKKSQALLKFFIKENIHSSILQSVNYEFNQTSIYANELQDKNGDLIAEINHTKLGRFFSEKDKPRDEFLFDKVVYDSIIEKDSILNDPTQVNEHKITVFAKLPKISIPTPYKTYNPDFAYLIEKTDGKQLFLVVETKGYKNTQDIPEKEQKKIEYAKRFFKALQKEMPKISIQYKTRVNAETLSDLLEGIPYDM